MIGWAEAKPDLELYPLSELTAQLPFTTTYRLAIAAPGELRIVARNSALRATLEHVSLHQVESGGLLVGRVYENAQGALVSAIEHAVPARVFDGTGTSLQMSSDVWEAARLQTPPGSCTVGWYHSHPNLGAFFSGTDRRTQSRFFANPYSIGLVVDPVRQEVAWFGGPQSQQISDSDIFFLG